MTNGKSIDIIFLSYEDETNILEVLLTIDDMRTPEIQAYREQQEKEAIRFIRDNKSNNGA